MRTALQPYGPTAPAPDLQLRMLSELLLKTWHSEEQIEEEPEREREREREEKSRNSCFLSGHCACCRVVIAGIYASSEVLRRARGSELGTS